MNQLWFERALLVDSWADGVRLGIENGRIAAIESGVERESADEAHAIAVPGLVNGHSHGFQRSLAGRTERRGPKGDSFWTWRETMYGLLDRLGPDEVEAITAQAYVEMLETGFTRVAEFHYLHHDTEGRGYADPAEMAARVAAAADETGIGLTLLTVFYAHGGFGGAVPEPAQRRFANDLDSYARLVEAADRALDGLDDAGWGVAPHSLRAVTPEELDALVALAPERPLHIHIAEQIAEVEACQAWSGKRPVEWLCDHQEIGPRWTLVHATHMDAAETTGVAASGATVALCPITEANLGDGLFPLSDYLAQHGGYSIGSDSNVMIDAARELQLLEYGQRLSLRARNVAADGECGSTGGALFRAALAGGNLSVGADVAGFAIGAPADIVSLDADHPALAGLDGDALLDGWIFSGRAGVIDRVWRFGREQVRGGRHVRAEAIAARYRTAVAKLSA